MKREDGGEWIRNGREGGVKMRLPFLQQVVQNPAMVQHSVPDIRSIHRKKGKERRR